jgi:hypothetical protein
MRTHMTLFFPDLNVWLALSDTGHVHSASAWKWREILPDDHKLIFSRYTQIGLLRLLTNVSVMGDQTLTLRKAWGVYDRWLEDPRVEMYPEPRKPGHWIPSDHRALRGTAGAESGRRLLPVGLCEGTSGGAGHLRPGAA